MRIAPQIGTIIMKEISVTVKSLKGDSYALKVPLSLTVAAFAKLFQEKSMKTYLA